MRLWLVVFAVIGCLATYAFGRSCFDRTTGITASLVLGGSVLYFSLGRLITLDMPVSILVTLSLYSFYRAIESSAGPKRRAWYSAFAASCALGVLTKGVMALAVPGPVILIWLTLARQWHRVLPAYIPTALLIFLAITAPWHILVSLKNPEFAHKYFIVEHFLRYTTTVHLRYQPMWFFIPILIVGFLPWTAFVPAALVRAYRDRAHSVNSFLLIWIGWVFVFFSISNSKLIPYILPLFPPVALLIGRVVGGLWQKKQTSPRIFYGVGITLLIGSLAGSIAPYVDQTLLIGKEFLVPYIDLLRGTFFVSGLFIVLAIRRHRMSQKTILAAIFGVSAVVAVVLIFASPHIQRPSIKPLVDTFLLQKQPGDKIVSFLSYYQDLPVYSQQTVVVVEAKGELEFGTLVEDTRSWMMPESSFLELWQKQKIWAVGRKTALDQFCQRQPDFKCTIIKQDNGNVLFTQPN